jgi:hypothetical protein
MQVRGNGHRNAPWRDEFIIQAEQQPSAPAAPVIADPAQVLERILRENPGIVNQINVVNEETTNALQVLADHQQAQLEQGQDEATRAAAEEAAAIEAAAAEEAARRRLEQECVARERAVADAQARERTMLLQREQEAARQEAEARQATLQNQQQEDTASSQQHQAAVAALNHRSSHRASNASSETGRAGSETNDVLEERISAHLQGEGDTLPARRNEHVTAIQQTTRVPPRVSHHSSEVTAASREELQVAASSSREDGRRRAREKETTNEANPQDDCNHEDYSIYKQESNPAYCADGMMFGGHTCCGVVKNGEDGSDMICGKKFVDKRNKNGFFPSGLNAIWYCPNFGQCGCFHALCQSCHTAGFGKCGPRRTRGTTSSNKFGSN